MMWRPHCGVRLRGITMLGNIYKFHHVFKKGVLWNMQMDFFLILRYITSYFPQHAKCTKHSSTNYDWHGVQCPMRVMGLVLLGWVAARFLSISHSTLILKHPLKPTEVSFFFHVLQRVLYSIYIIVGLQFLRGMQVGVGTMCDGRVT